VPLILASASPARRATLQAAGIDPTVLVTGVDEDAVLEAGLAARPDLPPAGQVLVLAKAKALAALPQAPAGSLVLGCDSMLELDGEMLGKPAGPEDAARRIRQQSGRDAVLHTGHWLARRTEGNQPPESVGATSSTVVHFADLTEAEIQAYVATGEPLQVAGAFTIDGLGGPFIRGVTGDHHGVVGLSLPTLRDLLALLGLTIPDLWRPGTIQPPL
jgi:septum formation protein